ENYLQKVGQVTNTDELCRLICDIGLYYDTRGIYNEWAFAMNEQGQGGLWQNPMELAKFLWGTKDMFKNAGVNSYLDIGTFNGFASFVIIYFLKAHVCPSLRVRTIDPYNSIHPLVAPYISQYYRQETIDENFEQWDLVFIDGNHQHPGPIHDFQSIRSSAKFAFFHDIVDRFCPDVQTTFQKVARHYRTIKFVERGDQFGIGLVILNSNHL
ncbi:hypothetical protein EBT31_03815, partial [bacterium]|nr:hypothetical protein [bacterium]